MRTSRSKNAPASALRPASPLELAEFLDLNHEQVFATRFRRLPWDLDLYREVWLAYMSGDREGLLASLKRAELFAEGPARGLALYLRALIALRLRVRFGGDEKVREPAAKDLPLAWRAEFRMVQGLEYSKRGENAHARECWQQAAQDFARARVPRRALRCRANILALHTRASPDQKRLFASFRGVIREAKRLGERSVEGVAWMNLSREYQRVGNLARALETADSAVGLLESESGSLNYFFSVAHRCHVLLDLGRHAPALLDREELGRAQHAEVTAACRVLDAISGVGLSSPGRWIEDLTPTWQERWDAIRARIRSPKLTPTEEMLVDLLSNGPKTRKELAHAIYGDQAKTAFALDRLDSLLKYFKKRHTSLLVRKGSAYALSGE